MPGKVIRFNWVCLAKPIPSTSKAEKLSDLSKALNTPAPIVTMLRTNATRPILRGLLKVSVARPSYTIAASPVKNAIVAQPPKSKIPRTITSARLRLGTTSLLRYATVAKPPPNKYDPEAERKILEQPLQANPEGVSGGSSVRAVLEPRATKGDEDTDMLAGIKADMETIKDTFKLTTVPKESYYIGALGVLPYLATSLSTVYLAWDINQSHYHGSGVLFSPETAHELLAILEPIQIGYGAVIISFLGAIHWGLEYAGYGGYQGYKRYAFGVIAPAIAWPTMLMPVEYALITQFLAFNFLYFADARATVRGWAPPWYATYRFVLTFVVGASIVVSLIGRGQIISKDGKLPGPADKMKQLRDSQWENLEKEERERRAKMVKEDEEGKEGKDDEDSDDE